MRVGIIGTGRMGRRRALDTLAVDSAELVWVCSRNRQRAETFLEEIAGEDSGAGRRTSSRVEPVANWESAVRRDDIDGIIVTAPNALHLTIAAAALEQGKAVLLEYPHATRPADGRRLIRLAGEKGVRLHVGLSHRYGPHHKILSQLLRAGRSPEHLTDTAGNESSSPDSDRGIRVAGSRIGLPRAFQLLTCSGNPISRWYDDDALSGGMFIASLYHFIDEARSYFGTVTDVAAHYSSRKTPAGTIAQDCGSVMLHFERTCTSQLTYARGYPKPGLESRRTILCEKGYIDWSGGAVSVLSPGTVETFEAQGPDAVFEDTRTFLESDPTLADPLAAEAQATLEIAAEAQDLAAGE